MPGEIFAPRFAQPAMIAHVLNHKRCALWAPMGTGKTTAVEWALNCLAMVEHGPTLVIAPPRVVRTVWPVEAERFDNIELKVVPVYGTPERRNAILAAPADVYCINYELVPWLVEKYRLGRKSDWPFRNVVSDEAANLRSHRNRNGGERTAALARIAHKYVERWINLDATPTTASLLDLWGPQWFIDNGYRLGENFGDCQARWFYPVQRGPDYVAWAPVAGALESMVNLCKDVCLSVEPPIKELPYFYDVDVDLPPAVTALYRKVEKESYADLHDGTAIEAVNAGAKSAKLLQIAQGAVYSIETDGSDEDYSGPVRPYTVLHDVKMQALQSIVNEFREPLLVAYHFKPDKVELLKRFPDAYPLDHDPETIARWNRGEIKMLLCHPASCGTGLNLQDGGRGAAFYGHWWSAYQRAQFIERFGPTRQHQAGHPRPVYVWNIRARHTVDIDVSKRYNENMNRLANVLALARE